METFNTFTQDELSMLSNALIMAISNAGQAQHLVMDEASLEAISDYTKRLKDLNTKICGMMKED